MDTEHFNRVETLGKYYLFLATGDASYENLSKTGRPYTELDDLGFRQVSWPEWTHGTVVPPSNAQLQALDLTAAAQFAKQAKSREIVSRDRYAKLFVRLIMRIENVSRQQAENVVRNFLESE